MRAASHFVFVGAHPISEVHGLFSENWGSSKSKGSSPFYHLAGGLEHFVFPYIGNTPHQPVMIFHSAQDPEMLLGLQPSAGASSAASGWWWHGGCCKYVPFNIYVICNVLFLLTVGNMKIIQKSWLIHDFVSDIAVQGTWGLSQSMSWEIWLRSQH